MLDSVDSKLVSRESAIPGLATVLDGEALINTIAAVHPGIGIRSANPYYVHYKPGRRCIVAYRLLIADSDEELLAYADAYGPDANRKLPKSRELARKGHGPLGTSTLVVDSLGIALYVFPVDRRLKSLRRLADPEPRANLLRRLFNKQPDFVNCHWHHLRYKPERRYVARLDADDGKQAAIKFFSDKNYHVAKRNARVFSSRGALRVAPLIGSLDAHRALAFEWQPGNSLHDLLVYQGKWTELQAKALQLTGAALAELHMQPLPPPLQQRGQEVEQRRLIAQAETLTHLCPQYGAMVRQLAGDIIALLNKTPHGLTGLHGDFNAHQVLASDASRVTFLDFDRAVLGDPAVDIGNFIAFLEREALVGVLTTEQVEQFSDKLIQAYGGLRTAPPTAAVKLYTASGLFYLSAEPFRYREPQWPQRVGNMLHRARDIINTIGIF